MAPIEAQTECSSIARIEMLFLVRTLARRETYRMQVEGISLFAILGRIDPEAGAHLFVHPSLRLECDKRWLSSLYKLCGTITSFNIRSSKSRKSCI